MRSSGSVRFISEHHFIQELVRQVRAGYGLVPFLGSGCSAHSGILMGSQFSDYLAWTVALCVADPKEWPIFKERWDLRMDGWPQLPTHAELTATRQWAMQGFRRLAESFDFHVEHDLRTSRIKSLTRANGDAHDPGGLARVLYAPMVPPFLKDSSARRVELTDGNAQRDLHRLLTKNGLVHGGLLRPGISCTSEDAIKERAIRSLYDWRSTLRFLSELKLGRDRRTLFLEEDADQSVIDNFNVHITRGRRPNLIHSMLCHLRQPARMRVLLTTNFDTLIEDAFANQKRRVEVISVSVRGALPDPEIVHARDTVVKLHGTFNETRADFSLDERPSLEDRRRFFNYVRGSHPEDGRGGFVPAQLLVAGYSGSDARCVEMMKTVLEGDRHALIFWICNSDRDRARLEETFPEESYGPRVIATVSERFDLLLYEFHQQLCLTLPPGGGTSYHINHNVAPVASFRLEDSKKDETPPGVTAIIEAATWIGERAPDAPASRGDAVERKILVVDGPSGVLAAMRGAMDGLSQQLGMQKVWLELEDYADTASLAHDLFQIIATRRGVFNLSHAELCPPELASHLSPELPPAPPLLGAYLVALWKEHIKLLKEYLGIDPTQWIIALYGRNGPGGCTGWAEGTFWDNAEYGDAERASPFLAFLIGLKDAGFNVLYAPYSTLRQERDAQRREELVDALVESTSLGMEPDDADRIVSRSFHVPPRAHDLQGADTIACYETFFVDRAASEAKGKPRSASSYPWVYKNLETELGSQRHHDQFPDTIRRILRQALHLDSDSIPGPTTAKNRDTAPRVRLRSYWRFNLLYGASLMRQSRHYSSFFSEGVLQCPQRFNVVGYDNDLLRHMSLEQLLTSLDHNPRVFLRKPGGFAWLYRDTRLALRCLVEAASISASRGPAREGEDRIQPVLLYRARSHFHIGDWYLRAFYVSGNAGPLMEAAYHFFQTIMWSPDAAPDKRQTTWRRGLHQLVKTLRRGDAPLRLWFGRGQLATWFSRKATPEAPETDYSPSGIRKKIVDCWELISGEERVNYTDGQALELLEAELTQNQRISSPHSPIVSFLSLQGVPPRDVETRQEAQAEGPPPSARRPPRASSMPPKQPEARGLDSVENPWWQDSDAGVPVAGLLKTLDECVGKGDNSEWFKGLAELRGDLHDDPQTAATVFQQLVEWTYLLVSRAKRLEHGTPLLEASEDHDLAAANPTSPKPPRSEESKLLRGRRVSWKTRRLVLPLEIRNAWLKVTLFANAVVEASSWIAPGIDIFINFEISKTLALYGIALARLGRFYEAHRRLNHAEAILCDSGQPDALARMGILELRRGEAYLLEALRLQDVIRCVVAQKSTADGATGGSEIVNAAIAEAFGEEDKQASAVLIWLDPQLAAVSESSAAGEIVAGLRRIVVARSDDAWSCLERSEALLGGQTHSALWWSRLRAMQLLTLSVAPLRTTEVRGAAPDGRHKTLATRVRAQPKLVLRKLWREGIASAPHDWYNRLRLLDFYVRALRAFGVDDLQSVREEVELYVAARASQLKASGTTAHQYLSFAHLENVQWRIEKLEEELAAT
ncbi:MAG: hypothetical protein EOO73_05570 [Myxococcales bacterium]|nr:MAG: hypothetical protein EOO73_05570 [Myxococcales bacterium]